MAEAGVDGAGVAEAGVNGAGVVEEGVDGAGVAEAGVGKVKCGWECGPAPRLQDLCRDPGVDWSGLPIAGYLST